MYLRENCPGNPVYLEWKGQRIKDCTNCTFPHRPENYDKVLEILRGKADRKIGGGKHAECEHDEGCFGGVPEKTDSDKKTGEDNDP